MLQEKQKCSMNNKLESLIVCTIIKAKILIDNLHRIILFKNSRENPSKATKNNND